MDVFELQGHITMDSSGFDKGVQDAVKAGQDLAKSLQDNVTATKAMEAEVNRLRAEITNSKSDFNSLKTSLDNIEKAVNDNSKASKELTEAMKNEKKAAEDAKDPTDKLGDEMDDLSRNSDKAESALDKLTGTIGRVVAAIAAFKAAKAFVSGISDLTKSSVSEYATYEQLEGGVNTIFGEAGSNVLKNAENAYRNSGQSVNEYLMHSIDVSGAIIRGLQKDATEAGETITQTAAEVSKAYDDEYKAAKRSFDHQYDALSEALSDEITAYKKASNEKIDTVKAEYDQRIKLIDEEANAQMAAIDDQIAAINALYDAENAERKRQKQEDKKAELEEKVKNARTSSERFKAERELAAYEKELREQREEEEKTAERKAQIEKLKEQKDNIKTEAQQKKEALKAERDQELADLKEAQEIQLEEMKKAQKAQLKVLKEYNEDRLSELKDYYTQQKALYSESLAAMGQTTASEEVKKEAAEINELMQNDAADIANAYGKSFDEIMAVYQSISRGNLRTVDNLFGGLFKEGSGGIEALLQYAENYRQSIGEAVDYSADSFSDIVKAIHDVSVATGVYETTQREAEKTLEGSSRKAKSSWQNLVLEISKENGDVEGAFKKFEESAETYVNLLVPRIETVLSGIAEVAPSLIDSAFEHLPEIIGMLGSIVKIGAGIVTAVCRGIYDHRGEIKEELGRIPDFLNNSVSAVDWEKVGSTISSAIIGAIDFATDFVSSIDWEELGKSLAEAFNAVDWHGVVKSICDFMIAAIKAAPDLIRGIVKSLDWDDVATVAALAFVPAFLKLLASELAASTLWKNITSVFTTKMGEAGAASAGSQKAGTGFLGQFSLVLGSGLAGWEFGSWVYDNLGDEIDETVWGFLDKTGLGKLLTGDDDNMSPEEYKAARKELQEKSKKVEGSVNPLFIDWLDIDEVEKWYEEGLNDPPKSFTDQVRETVAAAEAEKALESLAGFIKPQGVRSYSASPSMSIGNVTINMEGMEISSDYGTDRFVERINEQLQLLMARENAAVGGANW